MDSDIARPNPPSCRDSPLKVFMMRSILYPSVLLVSVLAASAALAQAEGPSERVIGTTQDGKRIVSMTIYGNDECPRGKGGEIVVCARQPEADRYRLPKTFRKSDGSVQKSMQSQDAAASGAASTGIGSCSAVGSAGSTGCTQQMMRQAREERRQRKAEERGVAADLDNPTGN